MCRWKVPDLVSTAVECLPVVVRWRVVCGERERAPPGKVGGRWKVREVCGGAFVLAKVQVKVKGVVRRRKGRVGRWNRMVEYWGSLNGL